MTKFGAFPRFYIGKLSTTWKARLSYRRFRGQLILSNALTLYRVLTHFSFTKTNTLVVSWDWVLIDLGGLSLHVKGPFSHVCTAWKITPCGILSRYPPLPLPFHILSTLSCKKELHVNIRILPNFSPKQTFVFRGNCEYFSWKYSKTLDHKLRIKSLKSRKIRSCFSCEFRDVLRLMMPSPFASLRGRADHWNWSTKKTTKKWSYPIDWNRCLL